MRLHPNLRSCRWNNWLSRERSLQEGRFAKKEVFLDFFLHYCYHFFFFFLIFSTLWVFKQKQTTLPPPSVFHLVIIAGATAAERAGSFLLSSESQLPATQDKAWLYLFISTIKETWKQIETVPVDCQPAFNFRRDFTLLADRIAQWKWCL